MTGIQHMVRDIMYSQENGKKSSPGMPWLTNVTVRVFATTLAFAMLEFGMSGTGADVID
jgi:hypothetical protein